MIPDPLGDAVGWVRDGGLLAYPTETVWGLGADATSERALERLRIWKGRGEDAPISILVEHLDALPALGFDVPQAAAELATAFWPGPLTLVMACRERFAPGVARAADAAVGVRCSAHPLALALARRCAREGVGPLTATSLNHSGETPARSRDEAEAQCEDGPEAPRLVPIDGAESGGDEASTVVDCTGPRPEVLRWGAVAERDLAPVLRGLGGE